MRRPTRDGRKAPDWTRQQRQQRQPIGEAVDCWIGPRHGLAETTTALVCLIAVSLYTTQ